jgi:SAM-dependent methyltransferase
MVESLSVGRLDHLTFRGNLKKTRYGWLRLTPAYSVHLVSELLDELSLDDGIVLDPYCGTGTTALVCAERGIACDTSDINPFLLWLARAKARPYGPDELQSFLCLRKELSAAMCEDDGHDVWVPPLHQIEKWWDVETLHALGRAMAEIKQLEPSLPEAVTDLLKVAFGRTMIERANVSFGHQSMSFKKGGVAAASFDGPKDLTMENWESACSAIASAAQTPIERVPRMILCDARNMTATLGINRYSCVITSPPYPNRMSYIRELRPYMYWLGYLQNGREAGELDWQAIGGTWGIATSNLGKWQPNGHADIPFDGFQTMLDQIAETSPLLSRYVHKYFCDMAIHCHQLFAVTKAGAAIHYIVGNSKFYDVLLPVEKIFAALFRSVGFVDIDIRTIRKRTSKKELYEYVVSGRKPKAG